MENTGITIRGIYRDILKDPDQKIIYDSGWASNNIVERCRILLATFMQNNPANPSTGIQYLAVGQGEESWNDGLPAVDPARNTLVTPFGGEPVSGANLAITYLDASNVATGTPTTRLQITATLEAGYPPPLSDTEPYPLREFGLFGHLGPAAPGGEDYLINYIRHPVIHKDDSTTLIRIVQLFF